MSPAVAKAPLPPQDLHSALMSLEGELESVKNRLRKKMQGYRSVLHSKEQEVERLQGLSQSLQGQAGHMQQELQVRNGGRHSGPPQTAPLPILAACLTCLPALPAAYSPDCPLFVAVPEVQAG